MRFSQTDEITTAIQTMLFYPDRSSLTFRMLAWDCSNITFFLRSTVGAWVAVWLASQRSY